MILISEIELVGDHLSKIVFAGVLLQSFLYILWNYFLRI